MNDIQEKITEICIKIAKRNEGALIILGDLNKDFYTPLVEQTINSFNIRNNLKLFESLALMDGAVLVRVNGELYAYGVSIKSNQILKDFGTRHSAGISASLKGAKAFVVSEEDKKIRVFDKGKMVMQIDALQKGIEKNIPEALLIFESIGVGAVGTIGFGALIPTIGITLIPGIIFFGGSYWLFNKLRGLEI